MNNNINNDIINDSNIDIMDFDYIINNNLIENKLIELLQLENIDTSLEKLINLNNKTFNYYLCKASQPFFYKTNVLKMNIKDYYIKFMGINAYIVNWYYIESLFNYYSFICDKYNKYILKKNFIKFCHIDNINYYNEYDINNNNLSNEGIKLFDTFNNIRNKLNKNIPEEQENYIESKLAESNNITGSIAIANKKFGYSQNNNQGTQVINNYITSNSLPNFGALEQKK